MVRWSDVQKAADAYPRVAAGRSDVRAAQGGVRAARAVPNPVVEASLGAGQARDSDARRLEWSASLTVPTSALVRRPAAVAQASAALEAAQSDVDAMRLEALRAIGQRYWALARAELEVQALTELDRELKRLTEVVDIRVRSGEARPVELTRVLVEAEKLGAELEEASTRLDAHRRELAIWMGRDPATALRVAASPDELPRPPASAGAAEAAQPRVAAARARVRARRAELVVERRARFPELSLGAFAESELDRRALGGTISLELPLFDRNGGRIAQAEAQLAAEQAREAAERRELSSELVSAEVDCRATTEVARRFRDRVLPPARAAAEIATRAYRAGESSAVELIDAQRTYLETRQQAVAAALQAQARCAELTVLQGRQVR